MAKGDVELLDAIPRHGGRRAGSGNKKGYSPKAAADLFATGEAEGASEQTTVTVAFARSRARKESALADMNELNYKIKAGEYVERAAVREASATLLATLAQSLRSLPDNLERKFHLPSDVAEEVEKVIDGALAALASDMEMFSGGVSNA